MGVLGRDFNRLWAAFGVSELGTQLSMGALPLIAVLLLAAPAWQVSLLAAVGTVTSALIAVPLAPRIEFRRKRPVMIAADLARALALFSVPIAALVQALSFVQLCVVASVQALGQIAFQAASGSHLKALLPAAHRTEAMGRLEATKWTMVTLGPALGGVLISVAGKTVTVLLDAVTFVVSALWIRRMRAPEPAPPVRLERPHWMDEVTGGWRYVFAHHALRALFLNAMLFGGAIMWCSPLTIVLMLDELHFAPWQYGLALGAPGIGGILGALAARWFVGRHGEWKVLRVFGIVRVLWLLPIPLATSDAAGLAVIVVANLLLLFTAGVFNPTFAAYRMEATRDDHLARVLAAWSISSKTVQPLFMVLGGVIASLTTVRTALWIGAVLLLVSAVLLPRRTAPGQAPS